MSNRLKRAAAAAMATAVGATVVPLFFASAAGAAPIHAGDATITTPAGAALASGNSDTDFTIDLPAGAACSGDSVNDSFRVQSYLVSSDVAPDELTFNNDGPVVPAGSFGTALLTTGGEFYAGALTAPASPSPGPGPVINIPTFEYAGFPAGYIASGVYNVGIACSQNGSVFEYWNTTKTIATDTTTGGPAQIGWTVGAVPAAPTAVTATPGDGSLSVAFSHAASTPATTQYTVTATPAGGSPVTATGTASPITVPGLANGTEYSVTVRATNTAGDSAESTAVTATPNPGARPAVQNLQFTQGAPGSGSGTLDWDAPTGDAPTGYEVSVSPAGPTIGAVSGTSAAVSGMAENVEYTFTVTPLHPAPYVGTAADVSATALPSAVVYQQLNVTVPEGVLTITQECGTGPTGCEVALGTATLITSGDGAGQFYEASAELHPITLTDTRDTDPGWTATGTMADFSDGAGASFSGDQLGWTPAAVGTGGFNTATGTYVQTVTPGAPVAPNTAGGLGDGATLAQGALGHGLGIFTLNAAVELLIPVGVPDGDYSGVLTITAS